MNRTKREIQEKQFLKYFNKGAFTMKQVSVKTNIDRANICRFIAKRRKYKSIYLVRKGLCPITKHRAGFFTTNFELYHTLKRLNHGK